MDGSRYFEKTNQNFKCYDNIDIMEAYIMVLQSKHDNVTKMDDKTPILMMSSHGRQTTPCSSPSALDRKFRGVHGLNHRHCIYRGCRCDLLLQIKVINYNQPFK